MSDARSLLDLRSALRALVPVALLAGCAQQPTARAMPYIAPAWAAKQAMLTWTEDDVLACFGRAKGSDTIAGWQRVLHERGECKVHFQFKDGHVHAAEGVWGTEQACWWTVEACERGAPDVARDSWRRWTADELVACFRRAEGASRHQRGARDARRARQLHNGYSTRSRTAALYSPLDGRVPRTDIEMRCSLVTAVRHER